ncbi:hypothetical protein [Cupriavidus sp. TMH.W2]|uniref:hypothetical protein n=1 Tax=Cupriavidus sp. TMH.W2 TaxID=3434465 RepID=UPI003D76BF5A
MIAKTLFAVAVAFGSPLAIAQQQTPTQTLAAPSCESGCRAVTGDTLIYLGTSPKTYRICRNTDYRANVYVDGNNVGDLSPNRDGVRSCLDVSGSRIGVNTIGTVYVGLVSPS